MISCNLCTQSFDESDPLIEYRKKRHEEFHTITDLNINRGIVEWK